MGKLGRAASGCLLDPLQICSLRNGRYDVRHCFTDNLKMVGSISLDGATVSTDRMNGFDETDKEGIDTMSYRDERKDLNDSNIWRKDQYEVEKEVDTQSHDSTQTFHHNPLLEANQLKGIFDLIHFSRLEDLDGSSNQKCEEQGTRQRQGEGKDQSQGQYRFSSSLLCSQLIIDSLEKENNINMRYIDRRLDVSTEIMRGQGIESKEEKKSELRENKLLLGQIHFAFHLALFSNEDESAAYLLSRMLVLSSREHGQSIYGVDASAIVDAVIDRKGLGVKRRGEYVTYCCLSNNAHVLHLLLSTYTLEWGINAGVYGVRDYVRELLLETAVRGMTSAALVLIYHMYREGLVDLELYIPELEPSISQIPKRTFMALKGLRDVLLTS